MKGARTVWGLMAERARCSPQERFSLDESGRSLTFGEYAALAERVAGAFAAQGIGAGTRVAWQLPTTQEALVLTAALSRLGAVQIPILPMLREREVGFICRQLEPELLLVPPASEKFDYPAMAQRVQADVPAMQVQTVERDGLPQAEPPASEFEESDGEPPVRWIFCSSGTTGDPKAALHADDALIATAFGMVAVLELASDDVVPLVFPITHIGGAVWLMAFMLTGCRILVVEQFSEKSIAFQSENGTTVAGAGTPFYLTYLKTQRARGEQPLFPDLRCCTGGGAPKPPELHFDVKRELGGVGIVSGYGLTECPIVAMNTVRDPDDRLAHTEGRPLPGMRIRVVKTDGSEAAPGESGEIRVKGPHLCRGFADPQVEAEVFDGEGYLRTGDLGALDSEGWLTVTGRLKDIIIRKGENISAKKIEDLLYKHPRIGDVAVIGLPDAERGELACAVVEMNAGEEPLTFEELTAFCRDNDLVVQETPERLEIVDALPRNDSGKVLKNKLKERFSER